MDSSDERKPLAPDRMRLTKSEVRALIEACNFRLAGEIDDRTHYEIAALNRAQDKLCGAENDAPDDAAWCLAQARLLCPDGYAVVSVGNPRCAVCGAQACMQIRLDPFGKSNAMEGRCAEHGPKSVIASAAEGK